MSVIIQFNTFDCIVQGRTLCPECFTLLMNLTQGPCASIPCMLACMLAFFPPFSLLPPPSSLLPPPWAAPGISESFKFLLGFLQTSLKLILGEPKLPVPHNNTKTSGHSISQFLPLLPVCFVYIFKVKTQAHVGRAPL